MSREESFDLTVYSVPQFLEVDLITWGTRLKKHHLNCMNEEAHVLQKKAWIECFEVMKNVCNALQLTFIELEKIFVVFEYELPRERGRRPDVLIIMGDNLIVFEFKGASKVHSSYLDQLKHYVRDFKYYHKESRNLTIVPVLVLTQSMDMYTILDGVHIVSSEAISRVLKPIIGVNNALSVYDWYTSEYAPLPSLLKSVQLLYQKKKLPLMEKVLSAGIPNVLEKLQQIYTKSSFHKEHHLVLIKGVPGAGKTFVGLQFTFENALCNSVQNAIFLSGNGPLVKILQHSLMSESLVKGVHDFLKEYTNASKLPSESIFVYDEAQRAWDAKKTSEKRPNSNAEPTDLIAIASKKEYCVLVALIGEGQEIYLGEEGGVELWEKAVVGSEIDWHVHCPYEFQQYFITTQVQVSEDFNLNISLRTHQADILHQWVDCLLNNNNTDCRLLMERLWNSNYPIYVTNDLLQAKSYIQNRYLEEVEKTFGIVASSKNVILPEYGIFNDYISTQNFNPRDFYFNKEHQDYCRTLNRVVTEFGCQGLELDMTILAWDADFVYNEYWQDTRPNLKAVNSLRLRKNSYRVLMTRGRDGMIIYVPNHSALKNTYAYLVNAGCKKL